MYYMVNYGAFCRRLTVHNEVAPDQPGGAQHVLTLAEELSCLTGGETGIGRATVESFARANGTVIIAGYLEDEGQDVVSTLAVEGHTVEFIKTSLPIRPQAT
jgi:hypothetical protein